MTQHAAPLAGRTIVVTRPSEQADALCAAVEARGARALRIPVIEIVPQPVTAELAALIDALDSFDLAFFVSANAARHGLAAVRARREWPAHLRVATLGKGSEQALRALGFANVIAPSAGFDSEAVLALPEFASDAVAGKRIVVFRGDGGRDLLGVTLSQRGATIRYAACYARRIPATGADRLLRGGSAIDALVLTSSEGVGNLAAMLGEGMCRVIDVPVFAPHSRICARAREAGFTTVIETEAGDAGVLDALEQHFFVRGAR